MQRCGIAATNKRPKASAIPMMITFTGRKLKISEVYVDRRVRSGGSILTVIPENRPDCLTGDQARLRLDLRTESFTRSAYSQRSADAPCANRHSARKRTRFAKSALRRALFRAIANRWANGVLRSPPSRRAH